MSYYSSSAYFEKILSEQEKIYNDKNVNINELENQLKQSCDLYIKIRNELIKKTIYELLNTEHDLKTFFKTFYTNYNEHSEVKRLIEFYIKQHKLENQSKNSREKSNCCNQLGVIVK